MARQAYVDLKISAMDYSLVLRAMRQGQPAYRDLRIHTCSPQVLRYQPGLRATVSGRHAGMR
jgi:hypothetical protein